MPKEIKFSDDARAKMFKGIETIAKAIIITMGPKGRNVILDKSYGAPQITNDGATIAKEITLEDKFENMGAELVKEAANNTNDNAGDGTTTATLLTYALAKEGLRSIRTGVNAVEIKEGMRKASEKVIEELNKNAKEVQTKEEIAQIASISAQDLEVGNIIADAMEKVGNEGIITVEEGQTIGLTIETTKGLEFDNGFISPYMVTNPEKMVAVIKNSPILITDQKVLNMKELLPLLEALMQTGVKDLTIIAEDVEGEALTTIILNKLKGILNILAIKAPGFGDRKKEILQDIAILTGATVISKDIGLSLDKAGIEHLGKADSVSAVQNKTTIIGGKGAKADIENRIEQLKRQMDNTKSNYDLEKLQERIAKLGSGVAVIKVGAASEIEMKEKKLRIEDALNATRAAIQEGIVAGGGVALLKAGKVLDGLDLGTPDQNIGIQIVASALDYPVKQIAENSGKEGAVIVNEIKANTDCNFGYDAQKDEFKNMIEAGIIDPVKVERIALQNAVSLAGMFLTTEVAIVEVTKKDSGGYEDPNMGMGGMGGMM